MPAELVRIRQAVTEEYVDVDETTAGKACPGRARGEDVWRHLGIAPYSFGRDATDADTILKYVTEIVISGLELQNGPAESFAGAPAEMSRACRRRPQAAPSSA